MCNCIMEWSWDQALAAEAAEGEGEVPPAKSEGTGGYVGRRGPRDKYPCPVATFQPGSRGSYQNCIKWVIWGNPPRCLHGAPPSARPHRLRRVTMMGRLCTRS
eukprot:gene15187-biopygen8360